MPLTKEGVEALLDLIIDETALSSQECLEIAELARQRAANERQTAWMFRSEAPYPNGNDRTAEVWDAFDPDHWKVG